MTVGGIELEISHNDAPGMSLCRGTWISAEITNLTLYYGDDEVRPYYREEGSRKVVGRIYDHLQKCGARSMVVQKVADSPETWEISIRPKDEDLAFAVTPPNVPQ
jgi:hypothetical protein